jgi:hypothetical protein
MRLFLRLYFTYLWANPGQPIKTIFGTSRKLANVFGRTEFHIHWFRGFGSIGT